MIRLLAESWLGLKAVTRTLAYREDWAEPLNLTARGVPRSFFAAILSLPLMVFVQAAFVRLANEVNSEPVSMPDIGDWAWLLFLNWMVFPVVAFILCVVTGSTRRYFHWLILHNWAVLFLICILSVIFAMSAAGITGPQGTAFNLQILYMLARYFVHFRVAQTALGLPLYLSLPMGLIPVIAVEALNYLF